MDFKKQYTQELNTVNLSTENKEALVSSLLCNSEIPDDSKSLNHLKSNNFKSSKFRYHHAYSFLVAFIIIAAIGGTTLWQLNPNTETDKDQTEYTLEAMIVLTFREAYYEELDSTNADLMKRFDLDSSLTANDLGDQIGIIEEIDAPNPNHYLGYAIYEYLHVNGTNIIIVDSKQGLKYFIFCNFIDRDSEIDKLYDASDFLDIYGISDSNDISSLQVLEWKENLLGKYANRLRYNITDSNTIDDFYNLFAILEDVGNDNHQEDVFANVTEEMWQNGYDDYMKGECTIRMLLTDDTHFDIIFYPENGYIYCKQAYYKLTGENELFINELINGDL